MPSLDRILLPVDFSAPSRGAGAYGLALARRFQSQVHIVHVVDARATGAYGFCGDPDDTAGEAANRELQSFLATESASIPTTRTLLYGDPARQIAKHARDVSADLILLPTHGLGGFRRFLLGSVAAKVLHDAECAVWTGVHIEDAPLPPSPKFDCVMCAVDLDGKSDKYLQWARDFAQSAGVELAIIHALPAVHETWRPELESEARKKLEEVLDKFGIQASVVIEFGEVHKAIHTAATRAGADLLIIGRGVAAGTLGGLRTHSYAIIRSSPCPVVSI